MKKRLLKMALCMFTAGMLAGGRNIQNKGRQMPEEGTEYQNIIKETE